MSSIHFSTQQINVLLLPIREVFHNDVVNIRPLYESGKNKHFQIKQFHVKSFHVCRLLRFKEIRSWPVYSRVYIQETFLKLQWRKKGEKIQLLHACNSIAAIKLNQI